MKRLIALMPLLVLILGPLAAAAGGYFAGRALRPTHPAAPATAGTASAPVSVEAGKIAVRIYRPARIDTLVTEFSVQLPEPRAAGLRAPLGHARLRDRALQILLDAAETPAYRQDRPGPELVAETLAAGLGGAAPGMAGLSVAYAVTSSAPR